MAATIKKWLWPGTPIAASNDQRSDSLGAVNFVSAQTDQVCSKFFEVDREPPKCLNRVTMKGDVSASAEFGDFYNRIDCSNFVVRQHD